MNNGIISIATLLKKPAGVQVRVNTHQRGFMQAPDGRQMYVKTGIRRSFNSSNAIVIAG